MSSGSERGGGGGVVEGEEEGLQRNTTHGVQGQSLTTIFYVKIATNKRPQSIFSLLHHPDPQTPHTLRLEVSSRQDLKAKFEPPR